MRVITSRTAGFWAATSAAVAALAIAGAPTALADSPNLTCGNGQVAMDGTCVTPTGQDTSADALEIPQGMASDLSTDSSPGDYDVSGAPSEQYLSERGY